MVIYDFSSMVVGAVMDYFNKTGQQPDLPLMRHIALNTIIHDKEKKARYLSELGVVLAFDGPNYWRRDVFPNYKQNRKKSQEKSKFDFDQFYSDFNVLKQEFKENVPYRCIEVPRAEADDIIATLCKKFGQHEKICIVGADKDFLQIQEWNLQYPVVQYSPWHQKFLTLEMKEHTLIEHICGGDAGDGIPNIWSDVDTFVTDGIRQKPFSKKLRESVKQAGFSGISSVLRDAQELERFKQNRTLIDLTQIPEYIQNAILAEYDNSVVAQGRFHKYCVEHKLRKIMEQGKI